MSKIAGLIRDIKDRLNRAAWSERQTNHYREQAEEHYIAAGKLLKKLKAEKPKGEPWAAYVSKHFKLHQSRADELIRIAENNTTVTKVREGWRKKWHQRKVKAKAKSAGVTKTPADSKPGEVRRDGNGDVVRQPGKTADGRSLCDIDPENDREGFMSDTELRAASFPWQIGEAIRLAEQCALLRFGGASASEITELDAINEVESVISAWRELLGKLRRKANYHDREAKESKSGEALH